jgi:hypothetical protein
MAGEIISFVGDVLEREGALVERPAEDRLEALLPEGLQRSLGLGEMALIVEADEEETPEGAIHCGHGSELLAKAARLALGVPGRAAFGVVDLPPPPSRPPKAYQGLNLSLRVGDVVAAPHWTLVGLGRYEATSDDQREGLVRVAISAAQGAPFELPELEAFKVEPIKREDLPDELIRAGFTKLHEAIMAETVTQLADFREAVARRHRRDAERVDRYFAEVAEDLRRRMSVRRDSPGLQAKLDALPAERKRRRAQLALNHAIQVKVELVGLVALRGPGLKAELEVRRRKNEVTLEVRFDGLANEWVPLRCDGCGRSTFPFAMCDEAVHLLCPDCWDAAGTGGHRDCFRCAGKPMRPYWLRTIKRSAAPEPPPAPATPAKPTAPPKVKVTVPTAPPKVKVTVPAKVKVTVPAKPTAPLKPPKPAQVKVTATPQAPARAAPRQLDFPAYPSPPKPAAPSTPRSESRPAPRPKARPGAKGKGKLQQEIIRVLLDQGRPVSSSEIREVVKVSADRLRELIAPLIAKGLVGKVGERRGMRYVWIGK